jgi:hypothetical protein
MLFLPLELSLKNSEIKIYNDLYAFADMPPPRFELGFTPFSTAMEESAFEGELTKAILQTCLP